MLGATLLALTAAVLAPSRLCFVTLPTGSSTCVALPGTGLAVIPTPDRRVVVPLAGEDGTVLVDPGGRVVRWKGRLAPLFFEDVDRAIVVLPGEMVLISYPERLPLARMPLDGVAGVTLAAISEDGLLAAVAPAGESSPSLLLVATRGRRVLSRVPLPAAATRVVIASDAGFALVAMDDARLGVVNVDLGLMPGLLALPAPAAALTVRSDGGLVVVGCEVGERGVLVALKVTSSGERPLKESFRVDVDFPVRAAAFAGKILVTLEGDHVRVRSKGGRKLRQDVVVDGARTLALMPDQAGVAVPEWDEE